MEGESGPEDVDGRVEIEVGPVPSDVAAAWLDNSLGVVISAREHVDELSVPLSPALLELAEAYLRLWRSVAASSDVFHWRARVDPDDIDQLVRQWVAIGRLTDADLELMGCAWAPAWTNAFYGALVDGCVHALLAHPSTAALGEQLRAEPPGRGED